MQQINQMKFLLELKNQEFNQDKEVITVSKMIIIRQF